MAIYTALLLTHHYPDEVLTYLDSLLDDNEGTLLKFSTTAEYIAWKGEQQRKFFLITDTSSEEILYDFQKGNEMIDAVILCHSDDLPPEIPNIKMVTYEDNLYKGAVKQIRIVKTLFMEKMTAIQQKTGNKEIKEGEEIEAPGEQAEGEREDKQSHDEEQEKERASDPDFQFTDSEESDKSFIEPETEPDLPEEEPPLSGIEEPKEEDAAPSSVQEDEKTFNKPDFQEGTVENPYVHRARMIQKKEFSLQKIENSKTVGVWSPIHRMGVTSFTMNFAFFLAEQKVYTAVLEGLTNNYILKDWLRRYTSVPENWLSFAKALHTDEASGSTNWVYRDVKFLPQDSDDNEFKWNAQSVETYMTTTKNMDITLVDMPTGEMGECTQESLHFMDELWVLVDDSFQEVNSWKAYIADIRKKYNLPVHLIANKTYPFSDMKRVSDQLNAKIITEIPALAEETMQNYYKKEPLYVQEKVRMKLQQPYHQLAKHLFGSTFTPIKWQPTLWERLKFLSKS